MPAFWIDSNILIQAARDAYQFDFAPGFWDFLEENIANENFCMPKQVEIELSRIDDQVYEWVRAQPDGFIVEPSEEVQAAYGDIADHVVNGPYKEESIKGFVRKADAWLIAHAQVSGGRVVCRELRGGAGAHCG
mgnify:CR=1 FL=1